MDFATAEKFLKEIGQSQLLEYYGELSPAEREQLLKDIESVDFSVLEAIGKPVAEKKLIQPLEPLSVGEIETRREEFEKAGLELLAKGKVAAVLLAGGQGTRLGFDKPKGMFDMGETRQLPIFALHMQNISSVAERAGRPFPVFIMTSRGNNSDTVGFFEENNYFGYPQNKIFFFIQDVAPTCSFDGKVYLEEKHRVSLAPNGNGGWYKSLVTSGLNKVMEREGVEWVNVCGVDNVLQKFCDPVFIGATIINGYNCSAKVVRKERPEENVGLLCTVNGRPSVIEYYEMDENLKRERENGRLLYCNGITLNYLFNVKALHAVDCAKFPYHLAKKKIAHIENGVRVHPEEPCGYKFETLVVDMVNAMESCLPFEVERNKEFAPVKNAEGADSVITARELLKVNGYKL